MAAGYSGTPLSRKLGIKNDNVVAVINGPDELPTLLEPIPEGVRLRSDLRAKPDIVIAFFTRRTDLRKRLPALIKAVYPAGGLWLAWPKKSSGVETDLTGNEIRALGLASGVVDIKVCAIDDTWSGHRFAHRVENR